MSSLNRIFYTVLFRLGLFTCLLGKTETTAIIAAHLAGETITA